MSYDFAIWKRSATTKTAMLEETYFAICAGHDHPAMAPFDLPALERAIKAEFGDYTASVEGPIVCEASGTSAANWLIVSCAHSVSEVIFSRLAPIALEQGLLVYDPQRGGVWGNKRPTKPNKVDGVRK